MREVLVAELAKEVLGPRDGVREALADSPLDEYITGVLAPIEDQQPTADIDAESELPSNQEAEGTDDDDVVDAEVTAAPVSAPALDPKRRPHSIGLSFAVQTSGSPSVDICISWARYLYEASSSRWARQPRIAVLRNLVVAAGTYWLDSHGNRVQPESAELSLHVRATASPHAGGQHLCHIHLVNRLRVPSTQASSPTPRREEWHLFQPQIRVVASNGTRVVPGLETATATDEEAELQFLHTNRPVLARGHLCAAMWRRIDPEQPYSEPLDFPEMASFAPFTWLDGELLPQHERQHFSPADVRTEFLPVYSVEAPDLTWPTRFGPAPELQTDVLAELWDVHALRQALSPLSQAYRSWISEHRTARAALGVEEQLVANRLIQNCEQVAARIEQGIDELCQNDDARLAFCFAMRAISVQSTWPATNPPAMPLRWHPFQLAFILTALESIVNPASQHREVCDLLWVATGAGKTEAYLALAAMTMAYRRRRVKARRSGDRTGSGVSILSRYTLRLLTIQQFRRTVKMVAAAELLRLEGLSDGRPVGWRPRDCGLRGDFIWGSCRFSAGLWVGGGVTPNRMTDIFVNNQPINGALSILQGRRGEGEPAQLLKCPACDGLLSIPSERDRGLPPGRYTLRLAVRGSIPRRVTPAALSLQDITVHNIAVTALGAGCSLLTINLESPQRLVAELLDEWWRDAGAALPGVTVESARASRPGYFIRSYQGRNRPSSYDFDIYCLNPDCPLCRTWCEGHPAGCVSGGTPSPTAPQSGVHGLPALDDGNRLGHVPELFRSGSPYASTKTPIPAYTVDEQVYHRCPSIVIATVDKFARPPFEPRAAGLFGNVTHHHCVWGYYREGAPPASGNGGTTGHPGPIGRAGARTYVSVAALDPPDLILQDELHLIEGPLGSLVGIYETAIETLCRNNGHGIKYIASTATVRQAVEQVQAAFCRRLQVFPPPGLSIDDRCFIRSSEAHPLSDSHAGRLYVGVAAPGRGPLTPIVRIWSRLLQTAQEHRAHPNVDGFWTLTGYFNARRELAGARALYRQDIFERLGRIAGPQARPIPLERSQELSGLTPSTELPNILDLLSERYPDAQDSVLTTSMFGTGVDIRRLGLMVVHGQPKTTSSYIQATGRVGRQRGAIVVTFLRASRPRDLNHYEFYCGYHSQLGRFVEPVTLMPFAPGALERAGGPVGVFILRNRRRATRPWHTDAMAARMATERLTAADVLNIPNDLELRARSQPELRRPPDDYVEDYINAALDDWQQVARRQPTLRYVEYAIDRPPTTPVVLGDPQHQHAGIEVVFRNVPTSLRDMEETCGFET